LQQPLCCRLGLTGNQLDVRDDQLGASNPRRCDTASGTVAILEAVQEDGDLCSSAGRGFFCGDRCITSTSCQTCRGTDVPGPRNASQPYWVFLAGMLATRRRLTRRLLLVGLHCGSHVLYSLQPQTRLSSGPLQTAAYRQRNCGASVDGSTVDDCLPRRRRGLRHMLQGRKEERQVLVNGRSTDASVRRATLDAATLAHRRRLVSRQHRWPKRELVDRDPVQLPVIRACRRSRASSLIDWLQQQS
jgi:hypothetical protein